MAGVSKDFFILGKMYKNRLWIEPKTNSNILARERVIFHIMY